MTTLPKGGLKTSQYKELSKSQLIKLLLKRDSINKPISTPITGKWESVKPKPVPRKSVNEDIILPPPKDSEVNHQNQRTISISTMTYSKPKTQVLENSK